MTTQREESEVSEETPGMGPARPLQVDTCSWPRCEECAALRRFTAKWNTGQIQPRPALTSAWWESPEAAALYARRVNLPRPNRKEPEHAEA